MPKRQRGLSLLSYAPQPSNKVLTAGEVLSRGTFLDIVRGDGLTALLVWNGKEIQFARQFDCKEASYFAIHIDRATAEAVRFPKGVRPYKSTRELFDSVTSLALQYPACSNAT